MISHKLSLIPLESLVLTIPSLWLPGIHTQGFFPKFKNEKKDITLSVQFCPTRLHSVALVLLLPEAAWWSVSLWFSFSAFTSLTLFSSENLGLTVQFSSLCWPDATSHQQREAVSGQLLQQDFPRISFNVLARPYWNFFKAIENPTALPLADYNNFKVLQIKFEASTGSWALVLINKAWNELWWIASPGAQHNLMNMFRFQGEKHPDRCLKQESLQ